MILKTKFPVKVRDTLKIENKNSISISVFGYKEKDQIYLSKKISKKKDVDLLLIGKKTLYSYQRFSYLHVYYTLHCGKKTFLLLFTRF